MYFSRLEWHPTSLYSLFNSAYVPLESGTVVFCYVLELNYPDPVVRVMSNRRACCTGTDPAEAADQWTFAACICCAWPRRYQQPNMLVQWKWTGGGRSSAHFHIWWIHFWTKCVRKRSRACVFLIRRKVKQIRLVPEFSASCQKCFNNFEIKFRPCGPEVNNLWLVRLLHLYSDPRGTLAWSGWVTKPKRSIFCDVKKDLLLISWQHRAGKTAQPQNFARFPSTCQSGALEIERKALEKRLNLSSKQCSELPSGTIMSLNSVKNQQRADSITWALDTSNGFCLQKDAF